MPNGSKGRLQPPSFHLASPCRRKSGGVYGSNSLNAPIANAAPPTLNHRPHLSPKTSYFSISDTPSFRNPL